MSDTFNYTLVKNDEGNFVVRGTVKSFNLDHVTDKDIVSFYQNFSEIASFDTGLLPLDGTGVLAVRTAGFQTQIVTQHAPGVYHVNWGAHEGDRHAKAYYVAQPYRIVIGDFEHGQLLGARMFYSPVPITSPNNTLYHVNLPNINCKGYRGNGVGWICLYHKDDWSTLPFNEKVTRFIERCSGVETYNDANMSETDGPRFYAAKGKPLYFTDPAHWQEKSTNEGFIWTLDDQLLIPVLVKDMDNQDRHVDDGQPLTLAMAMLGNYQAYYTDTNIPKMYNVISRSDMQLENKHIADFFKKSFATAPVTYAHRPKDDPYNFTVNHRDKNGSAVLEVKDHEDEEDNWVCDCCEESYSQDEGMNSVSNDQVVCEPCFNEYYVYIESAETHFHYDDSGMIYVENNNSYYHCDYDTIENCDECHENYAASGNNSHAYEKVMINFYPLQTQDTKLCRDCFDDYISSEELSTDTCYTCDRPVITSTGYSSTYPTVTSLVPQEDGTMNSKNVTFCNHCAPKYLVCPCGLIKSKDQTFANCTPTPVASYATSSTLVVNKCCDTCLGDITFDQEGNAQAQFVPVIDKSNFDKMLNTFYHVNVPYIALSKNEEDDIF